MINEDYKLLEGHHRFSLALRTGMKYIDVIMEKGKDPEVLKRMKEEIRKREKFQKEMIKLLRIRKRNISLYFAKP